ncbi:MAG: TPM domain-containing protein [Burkholderiales bacterium]
MNFIRALRHLLPSAWTVRRMFRPSSLARIEQAIGASEQRHRGQIRFAVEAALHPLMVLHGVTGRERAIDVFSRLRVWDTEHNNGVLIYLLLADRDVEIVADRGVHAQVGAKAWEAICREMERALRAGNAQAAVLDGINAVSRILEQHYPGSAAGDNELPDRPVVIR